MDVLPITMKISNAIDYSELWELFLSTGNEEVFSVIYKHNYDILYCVGLKYTSDIQAIEDSIQNVFIYLLKSRSKLKQVMNLKAYLVKSFRNQLFHDLKKQKRLSFPDQLLENGFDYFNSTEESILEKEELNELQSALRNSIVKLSPKQQEMIYLRFDCDLSYEQISGILDISVESCYKSVYRSIKAVKTGIDQMLEKSNDLILFYIYRIKKILQLPTQV